MFHNNVNDIRRKLKEMKGDLNKENEKEESILNGINWPKQNSQQIIFQEYVNERFHSVEQELSKFMHTMGDHQRELHDLKVRTQ